MIRVAAIATDSGRVLTNKLLPAGKQIAGSTLHGPLSPTPAQMLQRKSNCACGGGCPRCEKESLGFGVQTKMAISSPGDSFEQEADAVADRLLRMPDPISTGERGSNTLARTKSERESSEVASEINSLRDGGEPLPDSSRAFFEPRFGHDLSRVRIHSNAAAAESARTVNALAYTVGNDIVFGENQYAPETQSGKKLLAHELTHTLQQSGPAMLQRTPDDEKEKEEKKKPPPAKPAVTACPTFVSLTATINQPKVSDSCKSAKCRLELGCCTTPRGSCGNTKDSGAAFKGTVDVPNDCTGELGLMQNLVSTDRQRTLSDKSKECVKATSAYADGGVPWKGCKVTVTGAGTYSIESDDCPFLGLDDKMVAASVAESFKTFLLWKVTGGTWKPIGMVNWSWSASTTQQKGTDCASSWTAPGGSGSTATGSASTDKPVTSPSVQGSLDKWGPCDEKKPEK